MWCRKLEVRAVQTHREGKDIRYERKSRMKYKNYKNWLNLITVPQIAKDT